MGPPDQGGSLSGRGGNEGRTLESCSAQQCVQASNQRKFYTVVTFVHVHLYIISRVCPLDDNIVNADYL